MGFVRADQRGYILDRRRFRNRLFFDIGVIMLTLKEAAEKDGAFSARYLQKLCRTGRIKDAICHGGTWFLADDYEILPSMAVKGRPRKLRLEPRAPV